MILSLRLPRVGAHLSQITIHRLIAKAGDELRPGTPLLEVRVDLAAQKAQDCPPVSFYRIISTERAYLRSLDVSSAALLDVGVHLGIATSGHDESPEGVAVRALRTSSVAIQIDPLSR